jgi:hypothetical protein
MCQERFNVKTLLEGYVFEEHIIETNDGYFITLWHTHRRDVDFKSKQVKPILFMHGFIDEGSTWFFTDREKNLIYELLEIENFDIWIANSRESPKAKGHRAYS